MTHEGIETGSKLAKRERPADIIPMLVRGVHPGSPGSRPNRNFSCWQQKESGSMPILCGDLNFRWQADLYGLVAPCQTICFPPTLARMLL